VADGDRAVSDAEPPFAGIVVLGIGVPNQRLEAAGGEARQETRYRGCHHATESAPMNQERQRRHDQVDGKVVFQGPQHRPSWQFRQQEADAQEDGESGREHDRTPLYVWAGLLPRLFPCLRNIVGGLGGDGRKLTGVVGDGTETSEEQQGTGFDEATVVAASGRGERDGLDLNFHGVSPFGRYNEKRR
jgi:hypothetical protein